MLVRKLGPRSLLIFLVGALGAPQGARGQVVPEQLGADALRVYLDCSAGWHDPICDGNMYRQEIRFVNWVRQPEDAQVHVMVTSQRAGGGGTRYTLDFLGRQGLAGMEDHFTYSSSVTDVQDETLRGVIRTFRLGLVRFAMAAGLTEGLDVAGEVPAPEAGPAEAAAAGPVEDPWNFWVFSVDGNASLETEDLQENKDFGFGFNANRTTEAWRFNLRANGSFEREKYDLPQDDGSVTTVRNDQDEWGLSALGVKTLGAHWGMAAEISGDNSTQLNVELVMAGGMGLEYNYFPYSESNRRVLLARYSAGAHHVQYMDTTVFDVLEETVYEHALNLSYEAREPWGNANIGVNLNQFLDRPDAWSFGLRGFVRYRLFRGFSVNLNGEYRKVRDQVYLPKAELSEEDILLGRRQLPTESQMEFRIGLSYSFGSIFNNVVNERLRSGIL